MRKIVLQGEKYQAKKGKYYILKVQALIYSYADTTHGNAF